MSLHAISRRLCELRIKNQPGEENLPANSCLIQINVLPYDYIADDIISSNKEHSKYDI